MVETLHPTLITDPHRLSPDLLLDMYCRMATIRKFEDTVYDLYSRGTMPGLAHLYAGMDLRKYF